VDEAEGRVMRSNGVNGGMVDNAIYVDGIRTANPATLDETYELLRERQGMAWIGLYRPTPEEIESPPRRKRPRPADRRTYRRLPVPTPKRAHRQRNPGRSAQNDEIKRLTQTSLDQNEQVKRISAWAAILFAPTLVGTIYGMNFKHMPELGWRLGYPFALLAMAACGVVLYHVFKRRGWL
jgi:hypothetical protein